MASNDKPDKLGLVIAIKPKGAPPPSPFGSRGASPSPQANTGSGDDLEAPDSAQEGAPGDIPQDAGSKADRGAAGYKPAEAVCGGCSYFHCDSGDCDKVEGKFRPADSCELFEPCNPGWLHITPMPPHNEADENAAGILPQQASTGPQPQDDSQGMQ